MSRVKLIYFYFILVLLKSSLSGKAESGAEGLKENSRRREPGAAGRDGDELGRGGPRDP
jgi:hypothetical protein